MTTSASDLFKAVIRGRCIAHLHTSYTDGHSTVDDYCRWASLHGFETVVFGEHVRRVPSYDVEAFLGEIDTAREQHPSLNIVSGFEAKLLPGGELDIAPDIAARVQVLYFACHGFPGDEAAYAASFSALFRDTAWKQAVRIWAHPGLYYRKLGRNPSLEKKLRELITAALGEGVFLERNLRYGLLPEDVIAALDKERVITGADAHSLDDLDHLSHLL